METNQNQEQVSSQPGVVTSPAITETNNNKKIILISIISIIILSIGSFFAYKFSNNKDKLLQQVNTTLLPYEEIKSMTEIDYDKYLAQKITGFNEGGISGYAGPMLLKLIKNNEGFDIEAHMVPIPNIVKLKIPTKPFSLYSIEIKINNAIDKDGNNMLARKERFSKKVNQSRGMQFVYWGYPSPQILGATGTYEIIAGKKYDDISQVTGVVEMSLPINMQEVLITKKDKDKEIKQGQTTFKIKTFESNKIEILVTESAEQVYGDFDDYISFYGTNKEDIENYTKSYPSYPTDNKEDGILTTEYTYNFSTPVEEARLVLFDRVITKSYNFTLTKHVDTPEIVIKNILNDDQKNIVQAFIDFKKIIDSKDELGFIEYLRKQIPEEDREDFEKKVKEEPGKEEVDNLFSFISDFIISDISPDIFYTNATTWEVKNGVALLEIKQSNPGSVYFNTSKMSFIKKNGNWYFAMLDSGDTQLDKKILGVWAKMGDENSTFEIKEKEIYYTDFNSSFTYSLSDKNLKIKYDGFDVEFTVEMPDENTLILENMSNGEKTTFNRF